MYILHTHIFIYHTYICIYTYISYITSYLYNLTKRRSRTGNDSAYIPNPHTPFPLLSLNST